MSKSNALETDILELLFNATALPDLAQDDGSTPATNLYVSLHTSSPGDGGGQATNETTYGDYARVAVARTSGGWTVANGVASPVANIDFPECASGTATITHFGVGTNATAGVAGYLMYHGTVTPNIAVSAGVTPRLTTASTITED